MNINFVPSYMEVNDRKKKHYFLIIKKYEVLLFKYNIILYFSFKL